MMTTRSTEVSMLTESDYFLCETKKPLQSKRLSYTRREYITIYRPYLKFNLYASGLLIHGEYLNSLLNSFKAYFLKYSILSASELLLLLSSPPLPFIIVVLTVSAPCVLPGVSTPVSPNDLRPLPAITSLVVRM